MFQTWRSIWRGEIAKDGSKIYFSLQKDGKPYEGEKAVEKREGKRGKKGHKKRKK